MTPRLKKLHPRLALVFLAALCCACRGERPTEVVETGEQRTPAAAGRTWFTEVTKEMRLDFTHDSGVDGSYFFPEHVGSGGVLFDYDNDGDLDLYLINSGSHGEASGANPAVNRLYRQESDGRFTDQTERSGLGDPGYGMGAAIGDYDGDGDPDIYLTNYGPDRLYRNNGNGNFTDVSQVAGLGNARWGTAACFFDAERDGDLDLYVVTYVHHDQPKRCTDDAGRPEYCGPAAFRGEPDLLYRNNGDGTFSEVQNWAATGTVANKGLGVVCTDLDGDGLDDIYVANDGEKNELWINRGSLRFEDRSLLLGAGLNEMGKAEASMGIAIGDVDGDRDLDLFLTHLDRETNTLYHNLGEGGFEDATATAALGPESLPFTGFGTVFFDADLDGDLDLLVVNGRVRRGPPIAGAVPLGANRPEYWRNYAEPNLLFENLGDLRFENRSAAAGELCRRVEVSRAALAGDLDRDGDLDVVVTNCNGPARLYRNNIGDGGSWLQARVLQASGGDALGAIVSIEFDGRTLAAPVTSALSYLSAVEPAVHFGLGGADTVERLEIRWPDAKRQLLEQLPARRRVLVYRR